MKRSAWPERVLKIDFQQYTALSGVKQQRSPMLMHFTSKSSPHTAPTVIPICITISVFLIIPLSIQKENLNVLLFP